MSFSGLKQERRKVYFHVKYVKSGIIRLSIDELFLFSFEKVQKLIIGLNLYLFYQNIKLLRLFSIFIILRLR